LNSASKERRKLKTKWNESFKITFPAIDGQTSTHAPTLEQAHIEIETLVDRVLSGQAPVTKQENKERDAKAKAYDEIAAEVAQAGPKEPKDMLEFIKDAVKAQPGLGAAAPAVRFVRGHGRGRTCETLPFTAGGQGVCTVCRGAQGRGKEGNQVSRRDGQAVRCRHA
jgi:hypothetical protein